MREMWTDSQQPEEKPADNLYHYHSGVSGFSDW